MSWDEQIRAYFADRDNLPLSDLCREFGLLDEDCGALRESLGVFEEEYNVRKGLLRPMDPLTLFIVPPPSKNLFRWFFDRAAIEDKASELGFRLKQRRRAIGVVPIPAIPPRTVADYVRYWNGQ